MSKKNSENMATLGLDDPMTDNEIHATLQPLWDDILHGETFPKKRPLLAHYTSIATLEGIVRNDEVWFSNPLYMNDIEELKFGMLEGASLAMTMRYAHLAPEHLQEAILFNPLAPTAKPKKRGTSSAQKKESIPR